MEPVLRGLTLAVWLLAFGLELALGWSSWALPATWRILAELGLFLCLGGLHAWRSPGRFLSAPALLLLGGVALAGRPEGLLSGVVFGLGLATCCVLLARVLEDGLKRVPWAGLPLVLLAALGARLVNLQLAPVADPVGELVAQLRPDASASGSSGPPIVWITVDTLRADHQVRMASHQRLAERGVSFDRGMSASSWTVPALGSLHTGVRPGQHGAGKAGGGFQGLSEQVPTVAERLAEQGYATAAFVANPFAGRSLGFARGFQVWRHPDEAAPQRLALMGGPSGARDAARVVDHALDWLEDAPESGFFLWVHLMDPHLPYEQAPESLFLAHVEDAHGGIRAGRFTPSQAEKEALVAAYGAEVDHADAEILRLLDGLEQRGLLDRALIALTSDHGEEFWEHGGFEHGHSHHGEVVDVAVALSAPELSSAGAGVAWLGDIASTSLAFAGLATPGIDLREPLPTERLALAEGTLYFGDKRSARRAETRWILDVDQDVLYVEGADAGADVGPLLRSLDQAAGAEAGVNEDALRALGYLD